MRAPSALPSRHADPSPRGEIGQRQHEHEEQRHEIVIDSKHEPSGGDRDRYRRPAPEEYRRIVQWFRVREQTRWDEQMDADSLAGKLDFLFDEAESESAKGLRI